MTKTYSERRQHAYFAAAVELYKLVVEIADENIDNPPEGRDNVSQRNVEWAQNIVDHTYRKAHELETLGHEEAVATSRQNGKLYDVHHAALLRTTEGRLTWKEA